MHDDDHIPHSEISRGLYLAAVPDHEIGRGTRFTPEVVAVQGKSPFMTITVLSTTKMPRLLDHSDAAACRFTERLTK